MLTNAFAVLLFAVLIIFVFCALYAFFAGLVGLGNLISELLATIIIIFLLFGVKMFFIKALFVVFTVAILSIVGYKIIVRVKTVRLQDYEEKQNIGIYSESLHLKKEGRL